MANTHEVLQGVKDYTLELLGTKARDESVASAGRAESAATRSESDGSPFWGGSRQTHLQRRNF